MKPIDPAGFEQKFRDNIDPWNYATSPFERYKQNVLLRACGGQTYGRGLELACAIGVTTQSLARHCLRLLAVDSSRTAVNEARLRLRGNDKVAIRQAVLPGQTPRGPFDLIVGSEIAYYLQPHALDILLQRLELALAPGGRIVFLNHRRNFDDAAQHPALAHRRLCLRLRKSMQIVFEERHSRFDVIAGRKPQRHYSCPRRKPGSSGHSAIGAAPIGPMPGILARRRLHSLALCQAMSLAETSAICACN